MGEVLATRWAVRVRRVAGQKHRWPTQLGAADVEVRRGGSLVFGSIVFYHHQQA